MTASAPPRRGERALLLVLLLLAAALRGVGLGRDFALIGPTFDELHNFIQPIHRMWSEGTADPHVYSGYPGFFNWLAFAPVTLARETLGLEAAYVAARAVVAVAGVAGVALVWALGRALFGPGPALLGAALLAVSRGQVREAHFVSPDVLVASLGLAVLLVLAPGEASRRRAAAAGALVGLATALKYTGLLLAPALVAAFPRRPRRLVEAAAAGALVFAVAAPYALAQLDERPGAGLVESVRHYYGPTPEENRALAGEGLDLLRLVPFLRTDLGDVALLLAVASPLVWRQRAALLPAAAVVLATGLALAPANLTYPRHALPAGAALLVLTMGGLAGVLARIPAGPRRRLAGTALGLLTLAAPAWEGVSLAARFAEPSAPRRALGWIERRVDGPALVATSLYGLPLDPARFEVRAQMSFAELPAPLLCRWDLVVAREGEIAVPGCLRLAERFTSLEGLPDVLVLRPRHAPSSRLAPAPTRLASSGGATPERAAVDGEAGTAWRGRRGPGRLELGWDEPLLVERVEVALVASTWPQRLVLETSLGSGPPERAGVRLRPRDGQREGAWAGQSFALEPPRRLDRLRVLRREGDEWWVAEIRVFLADEG